MIKKNSNYQGKAQRCQKVVLLSPPLSLSFYSAFLQIYFKRQEPTSAVSVKEMSAYNSAGLLITMALIIAVQNNSLSSQRNLCRQYSISSVVCHLMESQVSVMMAIISKLQQCHSIKCNEKCIYLSIFDLAQTLLEKYHYSTLVLSLSL